MPDAEAKQAVQLLKSELERERRRVAMLKARAPKAEDRKILDQTRINIAELTKALAAYGVFDA